MANILVRGVPDDVHAALVRRAERQGQSLQQYLAGALVKLAERPTLDEVLARIDRRRRGTVGFSDAVDAIGEGRAAR